MPRQAPRAQRQRPNCFSILAGEPSSRLSLQALCSATANRRRCCGHRRTDALRNLRNAQRVSPSLVPAFIRDHRRCS
jgi:hypothetical protein